ncbi:MAG: response regulator, partial [Lachnospiraceae bacterium]|nr:response regulator [Lachnospiraceae bacterium]
MDNVKDSKIMTILKNVFLLFVFIICMYFVLGQIFLSHEKDIGDEEYSVFSEGWVWVKEDGTREEMDIPGKCGSERNELVVIENVIPDDVRDNLYLCVRSSKQEMKVYIDGKLRQEYTTEDTRWFGKVSAVAWVFIELDSEDAGKKIRIETQTDSSYTGVFHDIHYGEKWDIWCKFFEEHGVELMIGLLMLVLGVASIIISIALKLSYKKEIAMEYLGWGVFLTALWILANSVFRQVLFPSISVISDIAFFMVMLLAIPFMLYINNVQKGRYQTAFSIAVLANLVDAVICTFLHVANLVDFTDTIKYMGMIAGASIGVLLLTLVRDIFKGYIKQYKLVAIGIAAMCFASVIQLIIYFTWTNQFSGSVIAIGLVFVLIISFVNTMKEVLNTEREKQQAVTSNEAKAKFLANMSHEIRTPINAVLGMDAMILRECKDESIREYALNIQNAGQTLLSLINDILDFSKIESGKMEIIPVEYDFSSMIHDVVNMIMMRAEDKGLKMNLSVDSTLPYKVYGDEVRIRQVLTNLLTNAVKYTKEGSMGLSVSGQRDGDDIILSFAVEDTGIGIKPEDIQKLFARFERIEEERNRNIEGTGLGMSITMQLLKLMDSELMVESEYGVGSKFSFEIRQRIVNGDPIGNLEERIKELSTQYSYDAAFVAPNAHILVVDDNVMNRKVFMNLLKQTKVQVDDTESGKGCLELVQQKHYDIIFLDHMMPEMDGVETLHHMKEMEDYPCKDTPVIALTANAIQGAKEMYLNEGFDDFLSKPIQPEKLEKMIKAWLPKELMVREVAAEESSDGAAFGNDTAVETENNDLPAIEGVDWESALMHLPDKELLLETVYDFYSTMSGEADFLQNCYEHLDEDKMLDGYRIKVHAMKSSAALIGINGLSEKAKALEMAAKDG